MAHTLDYYLMNSNEYFTSFTKLQFLPGLHSLQKDMILKDVENFTLCGNNSVVHCDGLPITVAIINVTNLMICDIEFANCGKRDSRVLKDDYETIPHIYSGVLHLHHCTTVQISSVTITANSDVSGIVAVNTEKYGFGDIKVGINCINPESNSSPVNGIEFYYNDSFNGRDDMMNYTTTIGNYIYNNSGSCNTSYALFLVLLQESYGISMTVQDTAFTHLYNSGVLYYVYHGKSCGRYIDNNITFSNCTIHNNFGKVVSDMFCASINNGGFIYSGSQDRRNCDAQSNTIIFSDCSFVNNSNFSLLFYLDVKNSLLFNALVEIKYSCFLHNYNVQMIKVNSEVTALWQLSHSITIEDSLISSNIHNSGSLISSTNGHIKLKGVRIINNTYETIIRLYLSVLIYENYTEFSSNHARFIIQAEEGSYYLLKEYTTVNITMNQVYVSTTTSPVHNERLEQICYYQFISDRGNLDHEFAVMNYKILFVNNTYTAPQQEITNWTSTNCSWLLATAFHSSVASDVYDTVVKNGKIFWAN